MLLKQSSTAQPLVFLMVDSTDHVSAKTGLSPTVTLSKSGAAFASPAGAVTEIGSGWYKVAGDATDTNALGPLILHATGTGADPVDVLYSVVAYDPQDVVRLGLSSLPNVVSGSAGALITAGTGTAQLSTSSGQVLNQSGTGAGQLDFTSGVVKTNVTQLLGTAWLTPGTAGTPDVNVKLWNGLTTVALPLVPTVAGRALDVSTGGEAGVDWANVGTPGSTVNLSATTTNLVNTLTTYTGNTVQTGDSFARIGAAGAGLTGVVLPSGGLANVTAWTVAVTGNVTGNLSGSVGSVTAGVTVTTNNDKTGYALTQAFPSNFSSLAITAGGLVDITQTAADKAWGTAARVLTAGTNIVLPSNGLSSVTAWTVNITGNVTGNLSGSVGSVTSAVTLPTIPVDWVTASGLASDAASEIATATWAASTRVLTAGTNIVLPSNGLSSITAWTVAVTGNVTGNVSGSVGSVTAGVTVTTNNDKTGYALTQTFPTNFSSLSITAGGLADVTQTAADKVWGTATRTLTAGTNIVLPSNGLTSVTAWTVAITGNITGNVSGSVGSVTAAITLPTIPANWITSSGLAASAASEVATAVWQDATAGDFTVASSIGKALYVSSAAPGGAGGHLISGSNAGTTAFGGLECAGSFTINNGLLISRTDVNSTALVVTGSGTGNGATFTGGNAATSSPAGKGFAITGGDASDTVGGLAGAGLSVTGGNGALTDNGSADGVVFSAGSSPDWNSTSHGLRLTGDFYGAGLYATGGAYGAGIYATGGTYGDGLYVASPTSGYGVRVVADGVGISVLSSNAVGISVTGQTHGISVTGNTGNGILVAGVQDITLGGDGTLHGNIGGNLTGNVDGNVSGNLVGSVQGSVNGNVDGYVSYVNGNVQGSVLGNVDGYVGGNVNGNVGGYVGGVEGNMNGNVSGNVGGSVAGSVGSIATGGITSASFSTTSGAFPALQIVDQGTAQSATSTTLRLRAAATFSDSELVGATIVIRSATLGTGQSRVITSYVSSTDTATVDAWTTTPTGTITYTIFGTAKGSATTTPVDVTRWNGTAVSAPATAGIPDVNVKNIDNDAASASGTVTFPNATLASTTNISAGTITTVTTLTNLPAITANWLTAAGLATDAVTEIQTGLSVLTEAGVRTAVGMASANLDTQLNALPTAGDNANAIWDEAIAGHVTAGSTGEALDNAGSGGGGGGATPAQIWAYATRTLTDGANIILPSDAFANITSWPEPFAGGVPAYRGPSKKISSDR